MLKNMDLFGKLTPKQISQLGQIEQVASIARKPRLKTDILTAMDALEIVKKQTADWIAASPTASDDLKALHRQLHGKKVLDFPRPKW